MLADVLMCWNKQVGTIDFCETNKKRYEDFLFKNKKGQRKKKHVQRGTGEKKTIFAADNQQSRRFEARLAPRRCSIQNSPPKI